MYNSTPQLKQQLKYFLGIITILFLFFMCSEYYSSTSTKHAIPITSPNQALLNKELISASTWGGDFEAVKDLVERGADVNAKDKLGKTVLTRASGSTTLEIVKYLVENGADVNLKEDEDFSGKTALFWASHMGHLEIVKYLVENGASINVQDNEGSTALMWPASKGYLEIVKYLVENGADVNLQDNEGSTVLITASAMGHLDIVKYLVENGANINVQNNDGYTPFSYALTREHSEIEKYLLEQGAISNTSHNTQVYTKQNIKKDKLTYQGITSAGIRSGLSYVDFGDTTLTWMHIDENNSRVSLSIYDKPLDVLYTPFMMQGKTDSIATNQSRNANFRAWMGNITSSWEEDTSNFEDVFTILYEPDNNTQIYGKDYFIEIMRNSDGAKYLFINQEEYNVLLKNVMGNNSKLIANKRYETVKNKIKALI